MEEVMDMKTTRRWALAAALTLAAAGPVGAQQQEHEHQPQGPSQGAPEAAETPMVGPGMCMMSMAAHVGDGLALPTQRDARTGPIRAVGSSRLAWWSSGATLSTADARAPGTHRVRLAVGPRPMPGVERAHPSRESIHSQSTGKLEPPASAAARFRIR